MSSGDQRPNVVFVVMDTARSRDTSLPGSGETPMPFLREFARNGTVFADAVANAPWTLPSHASMFTGRLPSDHGTHAQATSFDATGSLPHLLSEAGYHAVGVSNNTWISESFGFAEGFDEFVSTWKIYQGLADFSGVARERHGLGEQVRGVLGELRSKPLGNLANLVYGRFLRRRSDDGAARTNRLVRDRIEGWADRSEPLFLFVNYLEPHLEYRPPPEFAEQWLPPGMSPDDAASVDQDAWAYVTGETETTDREFAALRGLYRGELAYLDSKLREFVEVVDRSLDGDTVYVFTSDHGENVGDHGLMDHQFSLHETVLGVPLAVVGPDAGGGVRSEPVQLLDLFPTVCDLAGVDAPAGRGRSLLDPGDVPADRPRFAEYFGPQPPIETLTDRYDADRDVHRYDRYLRAARLGDSKYVRGSDGSEWLFDLGADPDERENLLGSGTDRDVVSAYESFFDGMPTFSNEGTPAVPDDVKGRLEDLGYLQ